MINIRFINVVVDQVDDNTNEVMIAWPKCLACGTSCCVELVGSVSGLWWKRAVSYKQSAGKQVNRSRRDTQVHSFLQHSCSERPHSRTAESRRRPRSWLRPHTFSFYTPPHWLIILETWPLPSFLFSTTYVCSVSPARSTAEEHYVVVTVVFSRPWPSSPRPDLLTYPMFSRFNI